MAPTRRQYGSGCLLETKGGWAIRWREWERAPDGKTRRVLRYETLGRVSKKQAAKTLAAKVATADDKTPTRSLVTFRSLTDDWLKTVLPMYKFSTQKNHRHIVAKHLLPRFGEYPLSDITQQEVQAYVADLVKHGYAPKTIDHMHDVLSAIFKRAVEWKHLRENPTSGVRLPELRTVRPKCVLTTGQAASLLEAMPALPRAMVGLALLSGVRRGELFAVRWRDVDDGARVLHIREAVYEGTFGTPKTAAGLRQIPLSDGAVQALVEWKAHAKNVDSDALVFATRSGKPIAPNNVLRRWVFPACAARGLPNATWLTFRRTYSTWAHDKGVPAKIVAQLMGHARIDTTLNVYTQVLDDSVRTAAGSVGSELFSIVHSPAGASALIH